MRKLTLSEIARQLELLAVAVRELEAAGPNPEPAGASAHCLRCGHSWTRRKFTHEPVQCPKCHSENWNVAKTKGKNTQ